MRKFSGCFVINCCRGWEEEEVDNHLWRPAFPWATCRICIGGESDGRSFGCTIMKVYFYYQLMRQLFSWFDCVSIQKCPSQSPKKYLQMSRTQKYCVYDDINCCQMTFLLEKLHKQLINYQNSFLGIDRSVIRPIVLALIFTVQSLCSRLPCHMTIWKSSHTIKWLKNT